MPDLTTHPAWTCRTNTWWETEVPGSKGTYTVHWGPCYRPDAGEMYGWHCECPGFKYRRTCKHVDAVKAKRCGWNAVLEVTEEADRTTAGEPCCPECGGPVEAFNVGV